MHEVPKLATSWTITDEIDQIILEHDQSPSQSHRSSILKRIKELEREEVFHERWSIIGCIIRGELSDADASHYSAVPRCQSARQGLLMVKYGDPDELQRLLSSDQSTQYFCRTWKCNKCVQCVDRIRGYIDDIRKDRDQY